MKYTMGAEYCLTDYINGGFRECPTEEIFSAVQRYFPVAVRMTNMRMTGCLNPERNIPAFEARLVSCDDIGEDVSIIGASMVRRLRFTVEFTSDRAGWYRDAFSGMFAKAIKKSDLSLFPLPLIKCTS